MTIEKVFEESWATAEKVFYESLTAALWQAWLHDHPQ